MAEPMISIQLRNFAAEDQGGWDALFTMARAADAAGIDRLVVSDHIVFGERLDDYADPRRGGTAGGRQPTGPDGHWLEPLTTLSVVAGMTSNIRLCTGILLAALRRPAVLAKSAATLDVLSGGRLDLGVGVGWQDAEYEAAGLPFAARGRRLDHTLAVCQTLWTETSASYADDELRFTDIHAMPKPRQPGGVPLLISGRLNDNVLARIVRLGSGWIPWGDDVADPRPGVQAVTQALIEGGRDPSGFQVIGTLPVVRDDAGAVDLDTTMAGVPPLVEAGITDFRAYLPVPSDGGEATDYLTGVVQAFRSTVGRS